MLGFELSVQHLATGSVSVRVQGALDLAFAYRFDDAVRRAERDAHETLVLDLRDVELLDSAGLSRILAARRRARKAGRRLVLVRGPKAIQSFFALSATTEHFEFVGHPDDVGGRRPQPVAGQRVVSALPSPSATG
jgi:anti-sigma B factor antagonist